MNSGLFIGMLKVLMHRRRKPLMLILDSLPAHKGKAVKNYVESTNGKLELHFLPGYAPELNPDELVWNYMREPAQPGVHWRRETLYTIASTISCSKSDGIPPLFAHSSKPMMYLY